MATTFIMATTLLMATTFTASLMPAALMPGSPATLAILKLDRYVLFIRSFDLRFRYVFTLFIIIDETLHCTPHPIT